ncbi:MAG: adenosine deaminase family protein [Candidatus Eremiobacteraeota bacterium]|nr:adenosine deaminase family protein [Candidatus Eremiobacteraeota bacterium]
MDSIQPLAQGINEYRKLAAPQAQEAQAAPAADTIELSGAAPREGEKGTSSLSDTIKKLPKIDLHRHLEGSLRPETIIRMAGKYGISLPATTADTLKPYVCITEKDKTLGDFLSKFSPISELFVNTDAIREISTECVRDAKNENIRAMELRFSPMSMARKGKLDLKKVMDAVIQGVRQGEKETGIMVSLTVIIPRHKGAETGKMLEDLAEEYLKSGSVAACEGEPPQASGGYGRVNALDLACDEAQYPPDPYVPVFIESENDGLHRTIHAGEARGADSVRTAVEECHAERIGHGVRAFEDPALVQDLIKKGIVLEMCPTSNVQTGAVLSLESHPLKKFHDGGGKATINTDDPGVCDTDLNKEYEKALTRMGCTMEDLKSMILVAADAIFLPPPLKAALKESIKAELQALNGKRS